MAAVFLQCMSVAVALSSYMCFEAQDVSGGLTVQGFGAADLSLWGMSHLQRQ